MPKGMKIVGRPPTSPNPDDQKKFIARIGRRVESFRQHRSTPGHGRAFSFFRRYDTRGCRMGTTIN